MNMHFHKNKKIGQEVLSSYYATLSDILINEAVIKMIFQKQDCPEDSY